MSDYKLPTNLEISHVELQVVDLERMLAFYRDLLGFREIDRQDGHIQLSPGGEAPATLVLHHRPNARPQPAHSAGLYHVAYRFPDRRQLGTSLLRIVASQWPLQGASDHAVSEAIYFADPEGNGIEIYRDRPRADWPRLQDTVQMGNAPLDLNALVAEADRQAANDGVLDPGVDIGHMHLQVSDTATAAAFYQDLLGMDLMMELPTAIFLAAGGYHHHLGANTWHSRGAPPHAADMTGLVAYGYYLPEEADWLALIERLEEAGKQLEAVEHGQRAGAALRDQDANRVEILTSTSEVVAAKLQALAHTYE